MRKTGNLKDALAKYAKGSATVRVGVLEEATYPDGMKVAQVAFWNEYGTSNTPPRPFFRPCVAENKDKWVESTKQLLQRIGDGKQVLSIVGEGMIGDLITSIRDVKSPPNSPVTLLLKSRFPMNPEAVTRADYFKAISDVKSGKTAQGGNTNPLIWSGLMWQRLSMEVSDD